MVSTTTKPSAWPLPWNKDVKFSIRAGDVIERDMFEAELAGLDADRVYDFQLTEAFLAGVEVLLDGHPEDIARIREAVAATDALAENEQLPASERALLEGARQAVKTAWPPYRTLLAQADRRNKLLSTLAFRNFVTGWEGKDLPAYEKDIEGKVTLAAMKAIPPPILRIVGQRAYVLLWATGELGNFEPLLQSDKSRQRSKGTRKKAGSSVRRSGAKTPSSPSRAKSSPS